MLQRARSLVRPPGPVPTISQSIATSLVGCGGKLGAFWFLLAVPQAVVFGFEDKPVPLEPGQLVAPGWAMEGGPFTLGQGLGGMEVGFSGPFLVAASCFLSLLPLGPGFCREPLPGGGWATGSCFCFSTPRRSSVRRRCRKLLCFRLPVSFFPGRSEGAKSTLRIKSAMTGPGGGGKGLGEGRGEPPQPPSSRFGPVRCCPPWGEAARHRDPPSTNPRMTPPPFPPHPPLTSATRKRKLPPAAERHVAGADRLSPLRAHPAPPPPPVVTQGACVPPERLPQAPCMLPERRRARMRRAAAGTRRGRAVSGAWGRSVAGGAALWPGGADVSRDVRACRDVTARRRCPAAGGRAWGGLLELPGAGGCVCVSVCVTATGGATLGDVMTR